MAVIAFPSTLLSVNFTWGQRRNDIEARSMFGAQVVEASGPLWEVNITGAPANDSTSDNLASIWKSFLMSLRGKTNQVALWEKGRPAPLGTMRGTMTLNSSAAQGAVALSIVASGQAGLTLLRGDMIGLGQSDTTTGTMQLVMVTADATADGSGIISLTTEPPLRNAFSGGASVVWDKPTALFRRQDSATSWTYHDGSLVDGFVLSLLEDPRP